MRQLFSLLPGYVTGTLGVKWYGLLLFLVFSCSDSDDYDRFLDIASFPDRSQDFSLWQLEPFFHEVQMGYILRTDNGKIIVVDGGGAVAAPYLESYLKQLGGTVHTWILTHPHSDHIGALLEIMDNDSVGIERILHSSLDEAWVQKNEPMHMEPVVRYKRTLLRSKSRKIDVGVGDTYSLGEGVTMLVLGARNEAILENAINNSSLVFRVKSKSKSVLFLGDLGVEGGQEILNGPYASELKADYVQMAHHGQTGVSRDFYGAVDADYALWPTPEWLWNNQLEGKEINSGTYKTFAVRAWMDDLGIKKNHVSGLEGTIQID